LNDSKTADFYSELFIESANSKLIAAAFEAIKPETEVIITQRGKTSISIVSENELKMEFIADDFVSLRAMLGSYLRWLETVFSSIPSLDEI
jgi:tRNA threonylcarbamoyladenosine modification (KEOPS) complex  Pcc1 subunit